MFGWLKSRTKVQTPTYSMEIRTIFRECIEIVYQEGTHRLIFGGEKVGKKWRQLNLGVPTNLAPEDQDRVFACLGAGLKQLGYEYVIFRTGEPQLIPEQEQQAALAELREMGMETEVAVDKSSVRLKRIPGWKRPTSFDPKEQARRMSRLVPIVRGNRSSIEILAKSEFADARFV